MAHGQFTGGPRPNPSHHWKLLEGSVPVGEVMGSLYFFTRPNPGTFHGD